MCNFKEGDLIRLNPKVPSGRRGYYTPGMLNDVNNRIYKIQRVNDNRYSVGLQIIKPYKEIIYDTGYAILLVDAIPVKNVSYPDE